MIYVKELITSIRNPAAVGISDTLIELALLLEKFHGTGSWKGVSTSVDGAPITSELASEIRAVLIDFVERHSEHPDVGAAIFALTRCGDPELRPFFLRQMNRYCEAGLFHPMSQAEYGLTVLGDGVDYEYAPGETDHNGYLAAR